MKMLPMCSPPETSRSLSRTKNSDEKGTYCSPGWPNIPHAVNGLHPFHAHPPVTLEEGSEPPGSRAATRRGRKTRRAVVHRYGMWAICRSAVHSRGFCLL